MNDDLKDYDLVTVCESCCRASCWQGFFYCEDYFDSATTQKTVGELSELRLEDSHYWENG